MWYEILKDFTRNDIWPRRIWNLIARLNQINLHTTMPWSEYARRDSNYAREGGGVAHGTDTLWAMTVIRTQSDNSMELAGQ